jgi:hypothetical protein
MESRCIVDNIPDESNEMQMTPLDVLARRHQHKGYSEEMCTRCGWVMGHPPLNCQNDDTPHVFPSQEDEIGRLMKLVRRLRLDLITCYGEMMETNEEARRG